MYVRPEREGERSIIVLELVREMGCVCATCVSKPIRKEDGIFMVAHACDCLLATKMTFYVEFVLVPTGGRR